VPRKKQIFREFALTGLKAMAMVFPEAVPGCRPYLDARRFTMALTQLSAGIMAGVFSLTTIGSELVLAVDKAKEWRAESKSDVAAKDKSRKDKKSPWAIRQIITGGPKF
jgi:hypothetical protein